MGWDEMTDEQRQGLHGYWLKTLGQDRNPELPQIAERIGVPFPVAREVERLRQIVSLGNFNVSHGPFCRDNDSWTGVLDEHKGSAPIKKLAESLVDALKALDEIYWGPMAGNSLAAQLLEHFAEPDYVKLQEWISGVYPLAKVAVAAARYDRPAGGTPSMPDWVYFAAGHMYHVGKCSEDQYHALLVALEKTWSIVDGSKAWRLAKGDTTVDWSDPIRAMIEFQDLRRS